MKILVTGAKGFIGKNLVAELKNRKYQNIFEFDIDTDLSLLDNFCKKADFIFHLAGVNRPENESEFMEENFGFTSKLLGLLKLHNNKSPVMISSSTQAAFDNSYGLSKKAGEELMKDYGKETGSKVLIYRFPNVFGKWCRPNYNSAVATFCYNMTRDLQININDPEYLMTLVYIDDVVEELIKGLSGKENRIGEFCEVPVVYRMKLGKIVELLESFKESRNNISIPNVSEPFTKKLFSTYLSYLPENNFRYPLKMNADERGSFTEFFRTPDRGQVSVNILKPGIVKGNHWHHTKFEKFLVVSGTGVIRFRKIGEEKVVEYFISGEKMEVIDVPAGYTHNIENLGENDLIAIIWVNEPFNNEKPDTFFEEVEK